MPPSGPPASRPSAFWAATSYQVAYNPGAAARNCTTWLKTAARGMLVTIWQSSMANRRAPSNATLSTFTSFSCFLAPMSSLAAPTFIGGLNERDLYAGEKPRRQRDEYPQYCRPSRHEGVWLRCLWLPAELVTTTSESCAAAEGSPFPSLSIT